MRHMAGSVARGAGPHADGYTRNGWMDGPVNIDSIDRSHDQAYGPTYQRVGGIPLGPDHKAIPYKV